MSRNLIVSCDGTWNSPDQEDNGIAAPTNVVKIHNALAPLDQSGEQQLAYYHPGVGTEGIFDKITGGAFGTGLSEHLMSAYRWLAQTYKPGDRIFLFGFSRGAFTARSLGGMLGLGLLDLTGIDSKESWKRVEKAYSNYRDKPEQRNPEWASGQDWALDATVKIHFLGVWDTVGALGIPDDLELLNILDRKSRWAFHDTELGAHIVTARHAIAIDEKRSSFTVTRWSEVPDGVDAVEKWFPGVHCDVGGGYAETDLSDGALRWMMEAAEASGLQVRSRVQEHIHPNALGVIHNSFKGAFAKLRSRPRNIPNFAQPEHFHQSALDRQANPPLTHEPYWPTHSLEVGSSFSVDIYAGNRWNKTPLYLVPGQAYRFSAAGEWIDKKDPSDWLGTQEDGRYSIGDTVRGVFSFIGKLDKAFKTITRNELADVYGSRRVEHIGWFAMAGVIANDNGQLRTVTNDGSPTPHQYVDLTKFEANDLVVDSPGHLYCFANDGWAFYGNNRGSIRLTVTRVH